MTTRTNSTIKRRGIRAVLAMAAMLVAMALPAQAFAGDPTNAQYATQTQQAVGGAGGGGGDTGGGNAGGGSAGTTAVTPSSSGSLPFTGLDVIALVAVAAALTGTGFALRRLTIGGVNQ